MPKLTMTVPHALGQPQAIERLKVRFHAALETYRDHVQGLEEEWTENVLKYGFKALGVSITGTVAVEPSEVKVTLELPLMATMFKGTIEKQLRDELVKILA
jgi:hypothetical protein